MNAAPAEEEGEKEQDCWIDQIEPDKNGVRRRYRRDHDFRSYEKTTLVHYVRQRAGGQREQEHWQAGHVNVGDQAVGNPRCYLIHLPGGITVCAA